MSLRLMLALVCYFCLARSASADSLLVKQNERTEDAFDFVDEDGRDGYTCIPWKDEEKKQLISLSAMLRKTNPGLLQLVEAQSPIKVFRFTKKIRITAKGTAYVEASVDNRRLFLSDLFFQSKSQLSTLIHEFCHLADQSGRLSYSQPWLRHVGSSQYASDSPKEGFAEYCAQMLQNTRRLSDSDWQLLRPLLRPSIGELNSTTRSARVHALVEEKQYSAAVPELVELQKDVPTSPLLEYELGNCYLGMGEKKASVRHYLRAIRNFESLQIGDSDNFKASCLLNVANSYMDSRLFKPAKSLLDRIIMARPLDWRARAKRATCVSKLGIADYKTALAEETELWRKHLVKYPPNPIKSQPKPIRDDGVEILDVGLLRLLPNRFSPSVTTQLNRTFSVFIVAAAIGPDPEE